MSVSRHRERLLGFGMILFLLGLIAGLATPAFRNPRLGLSAHLEGVLNGMFLMLVGMLWERIRLDARAKCAAFGLLLWGGYVNWLACVLGGIFGASRLTPIAGAGFSAEPWQEHLVAAMFGSVGLTMLVAVVLLVLGLRAGAQNRMSP